jgi:gliding motility-associated-like protein
MVFLTAQSVLADDDIPTIAPTVTYIKSNGEETDSAQYAGSAPIIGRFKANPENVGIYTANYEWRFRKEGEEKPYLIRYEEDTEYTFTQSGLHEIVLYATFVNGNDTIPYTQDYWMEKEAFTLVISESHLEMPNAFSPNDDGTNDFYKAKRGWQSLVEFHAAIYNRWGQKLYEWDDPAGGWDGKFNGTPVKQGVYFCEVKAKGADGRKYHIRTDVNLLRGYTENENATPAGE